MEKVSMWYKNANEEKDKSNDNRKSAIIASIASNSIDSLKRLINVIAYAIIITLALFFQRKKEIMSTQMKVKY